MGKEKIHGEPFCRRHIEELLLQGATPGLVHLRSHDSLTTDTALWNLWRWSYVLHRPVGKDIVDAGYQIGFVADWNGIMLVFNEVKEEGHIYKLRDAVMKEIQEELKIPVLSWHERGVAVHGELYEVRKKNPASGSGQPAAVPGQIAVPGLYLPYQEVTKDGVVPKDIDRQASIDRLVQVALRS